MSDQKNTKLLNGLSELAQEVETFVATYGDGPASDSSVLLQRFTTTNGLAQVGNGYVAVDVTASGDVEDVAQQLRDLGAQNVSTFSNTTGGLIPLDQIGALEGIEGLAFARPVMASTNAGSVWNEAFEGQNVDGMLLDTGLSGSGQTIGILSDSFNALGGYVTGFGSGDLPSVINLSDLTLADNPNLIDEGRAMAELVHDIAPGAQLAFHTAFVSQADFAQGILDLAAISDVVVDDIIYYAEPFFQDGNVAQAVDQARADGDTYFSSAGNSARQSYEAVPTSFDSGTVNGLLGNWMDFDPGAGTDYLQNFTLANGATITLSFQWDEPFVTGAPGSGGSASDLDIVLFDNTGGVVVVGTNANTGGDPLEIIQYTNTSGAAQSLDLAAYLFAGPAPGLVKWIGYGGAMTGIEFATNSGTSTGHASAEGGLGIGAAAYTQTPAFGTSPPVIEGFSSAGGTPILFDSLGNFLSVPELRERVDVTGVDGVNNTFFGSDADADGNPNFFGTSAAAPNVAAVAALLQQAFPEATPDMVYDALRDSAIDMDDPFTPGFDTGHDEVSGHGLIDAQAALVSLRSAVADEDNDILGTPGDDIIDGLGGDDTIAGLGGDDSLSGGLGDDLLNGGSGFDTLTGDSGNDTLRGGSGNDDLHGSNDGGDVYLGGSGIDFLRLSADTGLFIDMPGGVIDFGDARQDSSVFGIERIEASMFDDDIRGNNFNNMLDGRQGNDSLRGGLGDDTLYGQIGNDLLIGNGGADLIFGENDNDTLFGGAGQDNLSGDDGADELYGGGNNDTLQGGPGQDTMDGGPGSDQFFFLSTLETGSGSSADRIDGFTRGEDVIDLVSITGGLGTFLGTSGFTGTGGPEVRYTVNPFGIALVRIDEDGDGIEDGRIAVSDTPLLDATDFFL